jgi:hypothetical protein
LVWQFTLQKHEGEQRKFVIVFTKHNSVHALFKILW